MAGKSLTCATSQLTYQMVLLQTIQIRPLFMTHSQMLGKVESGGGPIFKVVLEC